MVPISFQQLSSRKILLLRQPNINPIYKMEERQLAYSYAYDRAFGVKIESHTIAITLLFLGFTFKEREQLGLRSYSLNLNIALKRCFSHQN